MAFKDVTDKRISKYPDIDNHYVTGRSVLTVIGGNVKNQIPNEMIATFNVRCIPEAGAESALKQSKESFDSKRATYLKLLNASGITTMAISMDENMAIKHSYYTREDAEIVKKMKEVTGETILYENHGGNAASAFIAKGINAPYSGMFNDSTHIKATCS
ncbi:MAG: hypothetical protein ACP5UH_02950 [Candidatus Micrarchaeia archaeon]